MVSIDIPGFGALRIAHLALDYNGTLALDGKLIPGVKRRLVTLSARLQIHVLTADTFGKARAQLAGVRCALVILQNGSQDRAKAAYMRRLGPASTACVGNGRNDRRMLRTAALAVAVVQREGAAPASLLAADVIVTDVRNALDLLIEPMRLVATLRN